MPLSLAAKSSSLETETLKDDGVYILFELIKVASFLLYLMFKTFNLF